MSGYITPTTDATLGDAALTAVFQNMVVGITGIDPTLVRPRWQPQPPTQPPPATDWCALGITHYTTFDYPQWTQDTDLNGTQHRLERIDLLSTFYGPNASALAALLRDGIYVSWNFGALEQQGVKLRSVDDIVHLGEEINSQFIQRSDLSLSFMRMIERVWPIPTPLVIPVEFQTDDGLSCTETIINPT